MTKFIECFSGVNKRLRRDTTNVEANPSSCPLFDDRGLNPEVAKTNAANVTPRATTYYYCVKRALSCHGRSLPETGSLFRNIVKERERCFISAYLKM